MILKTVYKGITYCLRKLSDKEVQIWKVGINGRVVFLQRRQIVMGWINYCGEIFELTDFKK